MRSVMVEQQTEEHPLDLRLRRASHEFPLYGNVLVCIDFTEYICSIPETLTIKPMPSGGTT